MISVGTRFLVLGLCLAILAACTTAPAPVYDRSANPYRRAAATTTRIERPSFYTVRGGDTLYSIAWRYGLDYRLLAHWNAIAAPYLIYPDQRLRLTEPRTPTPAEDSGVSTAAVTPPPESETPRPVPVSRPQQPESGTKTGTGTANSSTPPTPRAEPPPKPGADPRPAATSGAPKWQWPSDGPLLSSFSANDAARKGLDIGGKLGQPVVAAAAGEVVYSGVGLIGYGELVIIKHDDDFLSAYGHNRKRLVSEGDRVSAGQAIAEMGSSGANRPMLHFEIRRNGSPVDPKKYLPVR